MLIPGWLQIIPQTSGLSRDPHMSSLAHIQAFCHVTGRLRLKCAELTAFQATGNAGPAVQELATEVMQLQKKLVFLQWESKCRMNLLSGV